MESQRAARSVSDRPDVPPAGGLVMRALIADDDRIATAILARALTNLKFEVSVAHDGESAWDLVRDRKPHLAIIDWMMPTLDGLDLCRRIRLDPVRARMYLIL